MLRPNHIVIFTLNERVHSCGTLRDVRERYSGARIVIPGHGRPGVLELIDHTIGLLKKAR